MSESIAAVVQDGVVVNMIVVLVNDLGETDFEIEGQSVIVLTDPSPVTIGWMYDGENFTEPPAPPPEE